MPEISRFYGIIISMYFSEHAPPHFHARYGKSRVSIRIGDRGILEGSLPPRALSLVMEWAEIHKNELESNWNLARSKEPLKAIDPLK